MSLRVGSLILFRRSYAVGGGSVALKSKKKLGKMGATVEKKVIPVETDARRLVKYVCGSNILKEGGEDVELKPDSEYPEWLWTLNVGKGKTLEEMDPDSKEYWYKVRKMNIIKKNTMSKLKKF